MTPIKLLLHAYAIHETTIFISQVSHKTSSIQSSTSAQQFEDNKKVIKMPASLCGTWDIISNDNLEGYMVAMDLQTRTSLPLPFRYQPGYTKDCPEAKAQEEGQEFEEFTKGLDNRQVKVRKGAW
ncbi:retinoid-binding protein 7a isoform X5 [Pungitius pungitius]|uniref:retinoid-binding protein 7a isoform X5 n=1 Tax=Pungitius pungitius TaxID=134920 RepID=UPI002E0D3F49